MAGIHRVAAGEHLTGIAAKNGFPSPLPIWNAPENAGLRESRTDMNLLAPGDEVFVPDPVPAEFQRSVGGAHRFTVHQPLLEVRIRLLDFAGKARAAQSFVVKGSATKQVATTDRDGLLIVKVVPDERSLQISPVGSDSSSATMLVGALDPKGDEIAGRDRLTNLGYIGDDTQFAGDLELELAVEEFQTDHGLPVTGKLDGPTQDALVKAHGS